MSHSQTERSFAMHMLFAFLVGATSILTTTLIANAAPIPTTPTFSMADALVPDAFVETASGRYRFDQFSFNAVPPGGVTPRPEDVFVTLSETSDTVMLLFQIVGGNIVIGPDAWDLQVGYRATALEPGDSFVGHTLSMNAAAMGDAVVFLNEEIRTEGGTTVASLSVHDNLPGHADVSMAHADFAPTRTIVVVDKDLVADGGTQNGNGVAFVSHFKQTFHTQPIPEPSGMALLLLGCAGLGMVGWYSRRNG